MEISEIPLVNMQNIHDWELETQRLSATKTPTFSRMKAQLPSQGRTNHMLAATRNMTVVLKTYAAGGENGLHAHTNEDHVFLILQGGATFYGPKGEQRQVRRNDCVMIPAGALYWFAADEGGEPLVMARIGAAVDASKDVLARLDQDGEAIDGNSERNKEVPLVLSEKWFE